MILMAHPLGVSRGLSHCFPIGFNGINDVTMNDEGAFCETRTGIFLKPSWTYFSDDFATFRDLDGFPGSIDLIDQLEAFSLKFG